MLLQWSSIYMLQTKYFKASELPHYFLTLFQNFPRVTFSYLLFQGNLAGRKGKVRNRKHYFNYFYFFFNYFYFFFFFCFTSPCQHVFNWSGSFCKGYILFWDKLLIPCHALTLRRWDLLTRAHLLYLEEWLWKGHFCPVSSRPVVDNVPMTLSHSSTRYERPSLNRSVILEYSTGGYACVVTISTHCLKEFTMCIFLNKINTTSLFIILGKG